MASQDFMNLHIANETMIRKQIISRGVKNKLIINAMRQVLRHEFVNEEYFPFAYTDSALPYSDGQTISQPYIVASMAEIVFNNRGDKGHRMLEIGTGSGYQTAVLSQLYDHVYSIDINSNFLTAAKKKLEVLGYQNVTFAEQNGYEGWIDWAPFDGILVSCAAEQIPETLLHQLAEGGSLVMPVGKIEKNFEENLFSDEQKLQHMFLATKNNAKIELTKLYPVMFLPMISPFFG